MGSDYVLHRARSESSSEMITFGAMAEIVARLASLEGMQASTDETLAFEEQMAREMERVRKEHGLPPMPLVRRLYRVSEGRHTTFLLQGDPVEAISVDHAAPWDLLPAIEALADLGPCRIYDSQRDQWMAPSELVPRDPTPVRARWRLRRARKRFPRLLWSGLFPGGLGREVAMSPAGDLLVVADGAVVMALDAATGRARWTMECGRGRVFAAVSGSIVIVGSDHPYAFGLHLDTGRLVWRLPIEGRLCCPPTAIAGSRFALATEAGQVVVASAKSGRPFWQGVVDGCALCPPVVVGRTLVAATNTGAIASFDASTGRSIMNLRFPEREVTGTNSVMATGVFQLLPSRRRLVAHIENWLVPLTVPRLRAAGRPVETPGILRAEAGPDDTYLISAYETATDGERNAVLRAIDRQGRLRWERQVGNLDRRPVRIRSRRYVLVQRDDLGKVSLVSLDLRSGADRSKRVLGRAGPGRGIVVGARGRLFVAQGQYLWALAA